MNAKILSTNPVCLLSLVGSLLCLVSAPAAVVWTGPLTSFSQASGSDPNQPGSQDRLTDNVWITRGPLQGIYNAKTESGYTHSFSPQDTEWSYGDLASYAALSYTNWESWNNHRPPDMVGQSAVLHLITDDVYLALTFTSWGGNQGGFSYQRSTPASVQGPSATILNSPVAAPGAGFRFSFTNTPSLAFTVITATNVQLPLSNWTVLGSVTDSPAGSGAYQFLAPGALTNARRAFYRVRWP